MKSTGGLGMKKALPRWVAAFVIAALPLLSAWGQDSIATVRPEDLLRVPQRYWARGVLFRDVLTSVPAERGVRIDTKMYFPFTTRVAGTCYASDEAAAAIRSLDLQRSYAFEAMVIQFRGRYYIIVSGATPVVDTAAMVRDMQSLSPGADAALTQSALKPIADIVWEVESSHLAYAREKGIPLCELYDPQSVHFPRAMELVRSAIMKHEVEQRAVSSEILAQYLLLALARACAATNLGATAKEAPAEDIAEKSSAPLETMAGTPISRPPESLEGVSSPTPIADVASDHEEAIPPPSGSAEESEESSRPTEAEPSFWQRWKARREQKRAEAEQAAEERERLEAAERERAAAEKARLEEEQRKQKEARAAEQKQIAEEKKRAKEEARRKREEEKAESHRKKKEARELEEARKAAEAERMAAENERKAFEAALREQEERDLQEREKALAETARREREESARKPETDERPRLEREAAARRKAEEQQRAIEQAERKRAEAEQQARDMATAEAERRAAETQASQPAPAKEEPVAPQPSWWEQFKERRRLAREEAAKRRQAWDEFLKQEEEKLRAEKEAKRKERERLAEEKRRAKEEAARQREAAAQVEEQRKVVLPPPVNSPPADVLSQPAQPEKPIARPAAPPAPAPVLPPQAPAVATAPVLPATVPTAGAERVEIDLSAEPISSTLSPETIQRLRQEEEAHYKRFLEDMRRETERQERLRKQLEREMERQMRR